jgi:hypothetical protein
MQEKREIKWRSTFVYVEPCAQRRPEFWKLLKRIKTNRGANFPWMMLGDFNEALWKSEHFLVTKRNKRRIQDFGDTLQFYDLQDLG